MSHSIDIPVTWGDTDAGGLIYTPRFFHFFIVGLNAYFEPAFEEEHPMAALHERGFTLPAVSASADFVSPLRAGETAGVETTIAAMGDTSLTAEFTVERREDATLAAQGELSLVVVDEEFEATSVPAAVRECVATRGDASD